MSMFTGNLTDDEMLQIAMEQNYIGIIFENEQYINEDMKILQSADNYDNYLLIRNKSTGGSNDEDIRHDPTAKFVKKNEFIHNGDRGLPFEVKEDMEPYISKKADTKYNRSKLKKNDEKFVKKIIEDNKSEIIEYWHLDPETEEGKKRMAEIEEQIKNKYKKRFKLAKDVNI